MQRTLNQLLARALTPPKVSAALREGVAAERNTGESAVSVAHFHWRNQRYGILGDLPVRCLPEPSLRYKVVRHTTQTANAIRRALTTIIEMVSSVVTQRSFG